jgi:hypothetical protein
LIILTRVCVGLDADTDINVDTEDGRRIGTHPSGRIAIDGGGTLELGHEDSNANLVPGREDAGLGLGRDEAMDAELSRHETPADWGHLLGGDLPTGDLLAIAPGPSKAVCLQGWEEGRGETEEGRGER